MKLLITALAVVAFVGPLVTWRIAEAQLRVAEAAPAARAARPPRVPIVAVGSEIAWNVHYVEGGSEQQTLDVYAPPDVEGAPVVVYVHRGEWAKGDKSEVCYKPKLLNEQGVVFVSVNYRLSGVAQHPAQVDDVASAIRWVHDHIAEYGGSARRMVLMGHSAGCHIASLVGLDPGPLARVGLTQDALRAVVCWSGGAYDLVAKVAEGGMYAPYIETNFGAVEADLVRASPLHHAPHASPSVRFLFVSGGEGKPGSIALSDRMAEVIRASGGKAEHMVLEGKNHFTADYDCGLPECPLASGQKLVDFVEAATADDVN